jgi:hypothetical protein
MDEADSSAIEERLARLERGVKRGKRAATTTMVVLVLLIAWSVAARSGKARAAGSGAGDLVARSLKIVDENGTQRVVVGVGKDGPLVILIDEKGTPRAALAISRYGPGVTLVDEKGNSRVVLNIGKYGPFVALNDEKGIPRAGLGSMPLGGVSTGATEVTATSSFTLFDKEGKVIWKAP